MLKVVQLRSIELHELLLTEKTGKREADEARKVEEWRQVGGRDQRGNSLAQPSARGWIHLPSTPSAQGKGL